ncbi:MFS transporter [Paenibacillus alkaliterrae]|uniref:MFS transporter n=1 Tax=Paenibacillus alkaliterrae TaxID=320909 RepID=UPI001F2BB744|nr:MFS transporter [Paenibacillus alkaliterrae]MCF2937095.1 MFS transporter [Paenibacillus alkaliterrae]
MEQISVSQRLLFTTITIMYWTSMYVYVPTLSPYLSDRGLSLQLIGIVLGSYGFVQMFVRFPLGILSDRLGKRKPFILLGMLTAGFSCLLFLIPGLWIWPLAGRLMAGVCASTWVAFTVLYASYFGAGQTGRAMGNISVMTVSGQMIGMLLSGWLTEGFSENAPFSLGAIIAGIGLLLAFMLKEPLAELRDQPGMSFAMIRNVVRTRTLLQVSLLSILAHGVLFITMFGFTPLKAEEIGAGGFGLSVVVFAFMLPHAFASLVTARWFTPRFGYWGTIGTGFVLSTLCTAAMVFADSLSMLAATQAINGFAQGLHMPLLLGLAIRDVEPPGRATAMGLYQALYAIGMFTGPFLAGWLNEGWGLNGGFLFGSLLGAAAAMLVWVWARQEHKVLMLSTNHLQ